MAGPRTTKSDQEEANLGTRRLEPMGVGVGTDGDKGLCGSREVKEAAGEGEGEAAIVGDEQIFFFNFKFIINLIFIS
ncbi:hypothetical protein LINPERHAP1_LOCUS32776 [Linum perenne]